MKYISVTVETTSEAADIVCLILMEEGTDGVSVKDPADIDYIKERVYWDYDSGKLADDGKVYVTGVYEENKNLTSLKNRLKEFRLVSEIPTGSLKIKAALLDSLDYEDEWKKYYNIIEIGALAVVPAWMTYSGDRAFVKINPGKAFGTGSHETTSMCLQLLQDFEVSGKRVIDVGCGSGILGLSALRLGAKNAYMSDIDPQAIEAACENAAINDLQDRAKIVLWGEREIDDFFLSEQGKNSGTDYYKNSEANRKNYGGSRKKNDNARIIIFDDLEDCNSGNNCNNAGNSYGDKSKDSVDFGKADILLANLTADILIKLKPSINKLLKKGGKLIISGIINERSGEIKAAFSDLTPVNHIINGQWQAFSFIV